MRKYLSNRFVFISIIFLLIFSSKQLAQVLQPEEEVKSNIIFSLCEYFNWPQENSMKKLVIAVFEDEIQLYPYLSYFAQNKRIKGKTVEIQKIKGLNDLSTAHVFYIDPDRSKNAKRYYESVKGKNILFFTDQCESIDESMINLYITKDKKLSFELNKRNLEANKFFVPNELLVLGGSPLDIKAVFDESEKRLIQIQNQVRQQQSEIEAQKRTIKSQTDQVELQKQTIQDQDKEIKRQVSVYGKLKMSVDSTLKVLADKTATLNQLQSNIDLRDGMIKNQESKINDQLTILAKQRNEIEEGQLKIESQKDTLTQQTNKIGFQQDIIYLSLAFLAVLIILALIILRSNRINKRINRQLVEQNNQIEEQKQELEDQKRQLEISNNELESFSYSVSHDLRSPLRIIDGYSNILIEEYKDKLDHDANELLTKIVLFSKKMATLIDDLLKLSRITRQNLTRENINVSAISRNIIEEMKAYNPDREIAISIRDNITAEADPHLLKIALENLIDNAIKFTRKVEKPIIEIGSFKQNGKETYFVKDNGAGFEMQYSDKLFLAFHRLHEESEFPGTGIGLSIVQRIIKRHGGTIWVEAEIGKGACFYFTLI